MNTKMQHISPFLVMDILKKANHLSNQGKDICRLDAGAPGFSAPEPILQKIQQALKMQPLGYTESQGLLELRKAIAHSYKSNLTSFLNMEASNEIEAEDIIITSGSSSAFILALTAAFSVGDQVGITVPGYPAYKNILTALGLQPVEIRLYPQDNYQFQAEALKSFPNLKGLILASPANPTGTVLKPSCLKEIANYCQHNKITLISDEIYHGLQYDSEPCHSLRQYHPECFVINSFSKYYAMTGWRLGWVVTPKKYRQILISLQQNLFISACTISQYAGIAALQYHDLFKSYKNTYKTNRDLLLSCLYDLGLTHIAPADGAFYIYADVRSWDQESEKLAYLLLEDYEIACTPGVDFDRLYGQYYLRFSYACETRMIENACKKLRQFVSGF